LGIGRINSAYACGGLKPSEKAVLVYLSLRYNERKGYAWSSIGDIAHACSCSPATVKRALRGLNDTDGGLGLISRDLRDDSVKKSRKSTIHWNKVEERATQFRPPVARKPIAVSAEDAATIEAISNSSGVPTDASCKYQPRDTPYGRVDEIVALVKRHFGSHGLFEEGAVRGCLHQCVDRVGSSARCLEVLEWICTSPINEGIRQAILASEKLGGYLRGSFSDWVAKFEAYGRTSEAGQPEISDGEHDDDMDRLLREGYGVVAYQQGGSQADMEARDRMLRRMAEQVGSEHISWREEPGAGFSVVTSEHASVAYMLGQLCQLPVEPTQFLDVECEESLRKVCQWAITDDGWAECIRDSKSPGEFFIEYLSDIMEQFTEES
jgi:hypothetical protein